MSEQRLFRDIQQVSRISVPALNRLLGTPIPLLHDGFVRLIDYMGSDESIVQAARISYGKGTKKVSEDRKLIRYLMRHRHTTPFEMCEIKLHVRVPMDCWRQWIRHRTANVNEYSTRYSEAIDSTQKTIPTEWRLQDARNRQGSDRFVPFETGKHLSKEEEQLQSQSQAVYHERLKHGVAREQARKDLPLSTYTEAYWKIDLHNLLHFLSLRMDPHAQHEIRAYANVIGNEIVARWCPVAWEAFQDYRINSKFMTRTEWHILMAVLQSDQAGAIALAKMKGLVSYGPTGKLKPNREREELEAKFLELQVIVPWPRHDPSRV